MIQSEITVANMQSIAAGNPINRTGISTMITPPLRPKYMEAGTEWGSYFRVTTIAASVAGVYIPKDEEDRVIVHIFVSASGLYLCKLEDEQGGVQFWGCRALFLRDCDNQSFQLKNKYNPEVRASEFPFMWELFEYHWIIPTGNTPIPSEKNTINPAYWKDIVFHIFTHACK